MLTLDLPVVCVQADGRLRMPYMSTVQDISEVAMQRQGSKVVADAEHVVAK